MTIAQADVNLPEILAELRELYPRYEQALVTNDVDTLVAMFWASPEVMRFGVTENLYGHEELEAFRKGRPIRQPGAHGKTAGYCQFWPRFRQHYPGI